MFRPENFSNSQTFTNTIIGNGEWAFATNDDAEVAKLYAYMKAHFTKVPVPVNAPASAPLMSAPTPAPTPVRVLTPAEDCFAPLTIIKTRSKKNVAFTIGYGALDENGKKMTGLNAHNACKVLVKESGFKWDSEIDNKGATKSGKGAYVGTVESFEKLGVVGNNVPVAAEYFDKARAKAQANNERRARKAARA